MIGKVGKVHQIDLVLYADTGGEERGRKTCSGFQGGDITLVLRDTKAVLYDRRTGALVDSKTFPPDPTCPTLAVLGEARSSSSLPRYDDVEKWVRSRLKR